MLGKNQLAFLQGPEGLDHKKSNFICIYSHLSNSRGGWNKRGGGVKVAKSITMEIGKNVEGGKNLRNQ